MSESSNWYIQELQTALILTWLEKVTKALLAYDLSCHTCYNHKASFGKFSTSVRQTRFFNLYSLQGKQNCISESQARVLWLHLGMFCWHNNSKYSIMFPITNFVWLVKAVLWKEISSLDEINIIHFQGQIINGTQYRRLLRAVLVGSSSLLHINLVIHQNVPLKATLSAVELRSTIINMTETRDFGLIYKHDNSDSSQK